MIWTPRMFPSRLGWHMQRSEIDVNLEFMAECLRLWDQKLDTRDIALIMFQPEYIVETTIRLGRERRRQGKEAEDAEDTEEQA